MLKSKRAGERVMENITEFIEDKLRLTVNKEKSQITTPSKSKFLGFHIHNNMGKSDADLVSRRNKNSGINSEN